MVPFVLLDERTDRSCLSATLTGKSGFCLPDEGGMTRGRATPLLFFNSNLRPVQALYLYKSVARQVPPAQAQDLAR